jgi:hypothetical protein
MEYLFVPTYLYHPPFLQKMSRPQLMRVVVSGEYDNKLTQKKQKLQARYNEL